MKRVFRARLCAAVFVALTVVPAMAGSTGKRRIENENSSALITLNTSSSGFCGTFIGTTTGGAPPATVAANSFSGAFNVSHFGL